MYTDSAHQLVMYQTDHEGNKPEVVLFIGGSCRRPLSIKAVCVQIYA